MGKSRQRRSGGGSSGSGGSGSTGPTTSSSSSSLTSSTPRSSTTASSSTPPTTSSSGGGGKNTPRSQTPQKSLQRSHHHQQQRQQQQKQSVQQQSERQGQPPRQKHTSLLEWCYAERHGLAWVFGCALIGSLLGLGIGTGHLTGAAGRPSPWRDRLGVRIRSTMTYRIATLQTKPWEPIVDFLVTHSRNEGGEHRDDDGGGGDRRNGDGGVTLNGRGAITASTRGVGGAGGSHDHGGSIASRILAFPRSLLFGNTNQQQRRQKRQYNLHDPNDPRTFHVLREAIIREEGGYVHPDLGLLLPAPCGADRGLGMVRSTYTQCQTRCMPGVAAEKLASLRRHHHDDNDNDDHSNKTTGETKTGNNNNNVRHDGVTTAPSTQSSPLLMHGNLTTIDDVKEALQHQNSIPPTFRQEEILLRIPLDLQMTREVALHTLLPLLPTDVQRRAPLDDLDDAALLVLLLAHERGRGVESRFLPYIATLPREPTCGYSTSLRSHALEAITALGSALGLDVNGWPMELSKASDYADKIVRGLSRDYGLYLSSPLPSGQTTVVSNIQWALCQVSSRATAGSARHGTLRLVPLMDMINHDADAGGFVELTGKERLENGDFIDATEEDSGTFVVRSIRHGRRKPLKKGQELLANYNVPHYSPLDWFISLGFVPPERSGRWTKIDAALPRIRRDGGGGALGAEQHTKFATIHEPPRPEL